MFNPVHITKMPRRNTMPRLHLSEVAGGIYLGPISVLMTNQLLEIRESVQGSVELDTRDSLEADWRSVQLGTGRQNWEFDAPLSLNGHALSLPIPDNVLKMTDA